MIKFIYFSIFTIFFGFNLLAQTQLSTNFDLGKNNVSEGLFIKASALATCEWSKYEFGAGLQMDVKSINENVFSGIYANAAREFNIKNINFEMQILFLYTPYSGIFSESNWAFMMNHHWKHFYLKLGTDFRTYAYTKDAIDTYELNGETKLHENWNMIYSIAYYLKPIENSWNIGIYITNIDYFLINQETNPEFKLSVNYSLKRNLKLFTESWYKSSGAFNLYVNPFGFFFRTGIIWDID